MWNEKHTTFLDPEFPAETHGDAEEDSSADGQRYDDNSLIPFSYGAVWYWKVWKYDVSH